jgi:hypothetical protein
MELTEKLIIKIINGEPDGHPMLYSNFIQCFPDIDTENLPEEYRYFERHIKPELPTPYHLYETDDAVYVTIDNVVHDHWNFIEMTPEEKQAKINEVMALDHPTGWAFNEETCTWEPPFPPPDTDNVYKWSNETQNWLFISPLV